MSFDSTAVFDLTRTYRFVLRREVDDGDWNAPPEERDRVTFIMLNPSTADETEDDPTIRRCLGFACAWRYMRISVVNLFAYRTPSPRALLAASRSGVDIVGPENDHNIAGEVSRSQLVVCAWGTNGLAVERGREVRELLEGCGVTLHYLRLTKHGHPSHPLYLPGKLKPTVWS